MTENSPQEQPTRAGWLPGVLLITIGVLTLVGRYISFSFDTGLLVLPGLAVIFLIAGLLSRQNGLFVPAGILLGIGVGTILVDGPLATAHENVQAGVILMGIGGGFILTLLLSLLGKGRPYYWALIPGGIMAALGAGFVVFTQFPQFLENWGTIVAGGVVLAIGVIMLARELLRRD